MMNIHGNPFIAHYCASLKIKNQVKNHIEIRINNN